MTIARMWELKISLATPETKQEMIRKMLSERTGVITTMGSKQVYIEFKDGSQIKSAA